MAPSSDRSTRRRLRPIPLLALLLAAGWAVGAPASQPAFYAPYAFLIGEWDVAAEGGPPFAVARFRWGPNETYIWHSMSMIAGGQERPHFEGLFVWNGIHKNLDMLMTLDLDTGRVQEQGTLSMATDSTAVRDIQATYAEGAGPMGGTPAGAAGATARFRQTYKALDPDHVLTVLTRETKDGWVPTFPGSGRVIMTRRTAGGSAH